MDGENITYSDIEGYERMFSLAPAFLLERFAKRNTNVVLKFESQIKNHIAGLNDNQMNKIDTILNTDIGELQAVMAEAYQHSGKKQYKILANPKYKEFVEINLKELEKLLKKEKE